MRPRNLEKMDDAGLILYTQQNKTVMLEDKLMVINLITTDNYKLAKRFIDKILRYKLNLVSCLQEMDNRKIDKKVIE